MEELHGVIFALRPPDLDDIGVVAAIERYIAQVQRSGLNVHLEAEEDPPAADAGGAPGHLPHRAGGAA